MFKKLLIPLCCLVLVFSGCNSKLDPWKEARKTYKRLDPWESYQTLIKLLQKGEKEQARYLVTNTYFRFTKENFLPSPLDVEETLTLKNWDNPKNEWIPLKNLQLKKIVWDAFEGRPIKEKVVMLLFTKTFQDGTTIDTRKSMTKINGFWQKGLSPDSPAYQRLTAKERLDEKIVW